MLKTIIKYFYPKENPDLIILSLMNITLKISSLIYKFKQIVYYVIILVTTNIVKK